MKIYWLGWKSSLSANYLPCAASGVVVYSEMGTAFDADSYERLLVAASREELIAQMTGKASRDCIANPALYGDGWAIQVTEVEE